MNIDRQLKHDFINQSLRVEILSQEFCEDLNSKDGPSKEKAIELTQQIESYLAMAKQISTTED